MQRRGSSDVYKWNRADRVLRMRLAIGRFHLFEIAMIGGDEHFTAGFAYRIGQTSE